jgi:hypothetical protein
VSYDAVNQVTRALGMLLHSQLTTVSPEARVTLLPPGDQLPEVSGVNLYLYRVIESPFTKNRDWPGDRVTRPSRQPALGLQLFYLLTPLGRRPEDTSGGDDAHTMLGLAMLTLHENPVLNDVHLPGFDADLVLPPFLLNSFEQVKVCNQPTSLEELSKIWASINRPYRLSVAYEVSLVELTPTAPPPVDAGIVTSTGLDVITLDPPRPVELTPPSGALAGITNGLVTASDLQIRGFGLSFPGQTPIVRVAGRPVAIRTQPAPTDESLSVVLPIDIDAGPQVDVRVTLNGRTSAPIRFTADPWLSSTTPIRAAPDPTAPAGPELVLEGAGFTANPGSVRFDSATPGGGPPATVNTFAGGGTDTHTAVAIPTTLPNGVYLVRVVLGDAASSVTNSRTLEIMPLLRSPIQLATVSSAGASVHELTLDGARLDGTDVRLGIDSMAHQLGPQPNPAQIVYRLGRLLAPGAHMVAVSVDGHLSHRIALEVPGP